jgi:hypothetical protein
LIVRQTSSFLLSLFSTYVLVFAVLTFAVSKRHLRFPFDSVGACHSTTLETSPKVAIGKSNAAKGKKKQARRERWGI